MIGRAFAFIGLAYLLLICLSVVTAEVVHSRYVPELSLLVVIYLGLSGRGSAPGDMGISLVIGYLTDLTTGAPRGLHAFLFAIVVLFARGASTRLLFDSLWQLFLVTLIGTFGFGLMLLALNWSAYGADVWSTARLLVLSGLTTSVFAPPLFWLLRRMDKHLGPPVSSLGKPRSFAVEEAAK